VELVGKFIKVGNYHYITIPAEVRDHWKSVLMEDVDIVSVDFNEKENEMIVFPRQISRHGYFRKVIKRSNVWLITVPREIANRWSHEGVVFLRKLYDEKLLKLVVKPM